MPTKDVGGKQCTSGMSCVGPGRYKRELFVDHAKPDHPNITTPEQQHSKTLGRSESPRNVLSR